MPTYTLIKADEVGPTKNPVYKLCVDGVCLIDEEAKQIIKEGSYGSQIPGLYGILRQACNLQSQSEKKYHPLSLAGVKGNVHEAKTRDLRMYALQLKGKKAIVLISKKTSQKKDLNSITSLIQTIEASPELNIDEI